MLKSGSAESALRADGGFPPPDKPLVRIKSSIDFHVAEDQPTRMPPGHEVQRKLVRRNSRKRELVLSHRQLLKLCFAFNFVAVLSDVECEPACVRTLNRPGPIARVVRNTHIDLQDGDRSSIRG